MAKVQNTGPLLKLYKLSWLCGLAVVSKIYYSAGSAARQLFLIVIKMYYSAGSSAWLSKKQAHYT